MTRATSESQSLLKDLKLVETLYRRTVAGELAWSHLEEDSAAVWVPVGNHSLVIREIPDPEYPDEPDYELRIYGEPLLVAKLTQAAPIQIVSNRSLRPVSDRKSEDGLTPYALLSKTYGHARRIAYNVDETVDAVLAALGE